MKRYTAQEDRADIRQRAINLAMTCAINKSSRSGFGWVLLNGQGEHISSGGFIIGERGNTAAIVERLEEHAFSIRELVMTGTPVAGMLDLSELLPAIENSSCKAITLGYDSELLADNQWQEWLQTEMIKVYHMPVNQISERLHTGTIKLQLKGLPWLTAISAGTLGHHPLKLIDLKGEFGSDAHIKFLANQYKTILFTNDQKDMLALIRKRKTGIKRFNRAQVETIEDVIKELKLAAFKNQTSILLLCDNDFIKQVISHDLCDEIVYQISFSANEIKQKSVGLPSVPFENWAIQNCETVGRSIRLTLEREYPESNVPSLSVRFN